MKNNFENIDDLIARILSGEGTADEQSRLDEWLALSEENKKAFALSKKIFEQSNTLKDQISVDTDKAWLKVKNSLNRENGKPKIIPISTAQKWKPVLRIAAMIVVAAGLGAMVYFFVLNKKERNNIIVETVDSVRTDTLPDGSYFTLNKNSSVSYSSNGYRSNRSVELKGEAFFDVKHDESRNFSVEAGGLTVQDVGTSFNVKIFPDSKLVVVTVATGEVKIIAHGKAALPLTAGETASYNKETNSFTRSATEDKNIAAYKDKIFIFENTELQVIVKLLNDIYGKNIVLGNDSLKSCRLTASFNNETLDTILDVIVETLHLQFEKSETEIRLNGNGCK